MEAPEQLVRQNIDNLLDKCGWIGQSRIEMNLGSGRGLANGLGTVLQTGDQVIIELLKTYPSIHRSPFYFP